MEASELSTARGPVVMRQAALAAVDELLALYLAAAQWMIERGINQWNPQMFTDTWLRKGITAEEFHAAWAGNKVAGALRLQWEDKEVWGEQPDDAGYVHSLVVARDWGGVGLGAALLDWAAATIAASGRSFLRLDCSADNPVLRAYYERYGFSYRGDVGEKWRASRYEKRI